eukprot:scpid33070/ scgid33120/ 
MEAPCGGLHSFLARVVCWLSASCIMACVGQIADNERILQTKRPPSQTDVVDSLFHDHAQSLLDPVTGEGKGHNGDLSVTLPPRPLDYVRFGQGHGARPTFDYGHMGGMIGVGYQQGELNLLPAEGNAAATAETKRMGNNQPRLPPMESIGAGDANGQGSAGSSSSHRAINTILNSGANHGTIPGLIQEQWSRGGRLNLTCQHVLWPTHLLELCDFDPLYRIVGQRQPSVQELLKLTRHYAMIYAQIRSQTTELCADAAVEHICHQQVPRCEQSAVNSVTGMAVWSIEGVNTQCFNVHRYCHSPQSRRVLSEMKICTGGGDVITGRYELNTCKPIANSAMGARRSRMPGGVGGAFRPGFGQQARTTCTSSVAPGIRVPDFQIPFFQIHRQMNAQLMQLQRAAAQGALPRVCRQLVQQFACTPEQQCSADGRRMVSGRSKEQCMAVKTCLQQSMFHFAIDCGSLPSKQSVAELDLRPSRHGSAIGMKKVKGPRGFFFSSAPRHALDYPLPVLAVAFVLSFLAT